MQKLIVKWGGEKNLILAHFIKWSQCPRIILKTYCRVALFDVPNTQGRIDVAIAIECEPRMLNLDKVV
jgi:hypothetical protein